LVVDRLDKRLRDPEIITKKFNVPLLGIVPTIDELSLDAKDKKKNEKEEE
jgi:capsular polysaccharide biosynthesis protein